MRKEEEKKQLDNNYKKLSKRIVMGTGWLKWNIFPLLIPFK